MVNQDLRHLVRFGKLITRALIISPRLFNAFSDSESFGSSGRVGSMYVTVPFLRGKGRADHRLGKE